MWTKNKSFESINWNLHEIPNLHGKISIVLVSFVLGSR